jgi:predicted permease
MIPVEFFTKEISISMFNTAMGKKLIQMESSMKENSNKVSKMDTVKFTGQLVINTRENL